MSFFLEPESYISLVRQVIISESLAMKKPAPDPKKRRANDMPDQLVKD
jgi:hypothetical protein